jgi:membrane-bound serine protease (ClpP class)
MLYMVYFNCVMKSRIILATVLILLSVALSLFADAKIFHATLDGPISPASKEFIIRAIEKSEGEGASLLVIKLNTPGGLSESMRDIVMAELSSSVPIAVFVAPAGARAASAGALVTLAADIAAMAPGTNIGAAHPVALIPSDTGDDETMKQKAVNDAVAFAKSVAEERGRNVEWAERAIRESSSLTAREALDQGVIDLLSDDLSSLLKQLDGYVLPSGKIIYTIGIPLEEIQTTLRERLLGYLTDPNIVYILFILGLAGLVYEFFQPGIGFGLATGGICLVLAFLGLQMLPVNIVGVLLIVFGIALMVLDVFTPTDGILTAGGIVALLIGSLTLFDIQDKTVGLSLVTVFLVVGVASALSVFVISKALLIQRKAPVTGMNLIIGMRGVAKSVINPYGKVFVNGEYWSARSLEGRIGLGEEVEVMEMESRTLLVRRSQPTSTDQPNQEDAR